MRRLALGLLFVALLLAAVGSASAAPGDRAAARDVPLAAGNTSPKGITWDGSYLMVANGSLGDSTVYAYSPVGVPQPGANFLGGGGEPTQGITWDGTYYRVLRAQNNVRQVRAVNSEGISITSAYISLPTTIGSARGITWDGTYLRLVDSGDDRVYSYSALGLPVTTVDFDLVTANTNPQGITWDGTYYRVLDDTGNKVYSYDSSGTHTPTADFDIVGLVNPSLRGIAWDGEYYRILSNTTILAYEGVADPEPLGATVTATVATYGDWKCMRSQAGVSVRLNNATVTVHGFCAQIPGGIGMDVEIHLASSTTYSDLQRFAGATGTWAFHEDGEADSLIYRDRRDSADGNLVFTEEAGGVEASTRLGFATVAKSVEDNDCVESANREGFVCDRTFLSDLAAGDTGVLRFFLTEDQALETAATPPAPNSLSVSRSADYETATVAWVLYAGVVEYQVERLAAVTVAAGDEVRIEYGDPVIFMVDGTQAGVNSYEDSTVEGNLTYQYRVRARGAGDDSWSVWSDYVFSGAKPTVDILAPGNLELSRDADSVTVSWRAPTGDFDNYTLQRQELIVVQGSTFFGNPVTLGGGSWLPSSSTMYTDSDILPQQTYEYRVAAVRDDEVGAYTDPWLRIAPAVLTLGAAPANFHMTAGNDNVLEDRREFWMEWGDVDAADDYEVQVLVYDVRTTGQSMEGHVVTDPTYFRTSYGRVDLRVRGRKLDADVCGAAADDRCLTEWTAWVPVGFTPSVVIPAPPTVDDTADTSIMDLREDTVEAIEGALNPAGGVVEGGRVIEFLVVLFAGVVGGLSVVLAWRRGMAALGVGAGCAIAILILVTGDRLYGTPQAWWVGPQVVIAVMGVIAGVRQLGVFR